GYKLVGRCEAGDQALELCKIEKPDVVLMDIHLEGEIDGIETAERIQREFEIPVIFVTSDTSSYIVERAIISNSYGYLVKPVKKNELGIS
ncbi:response regulator, partial [Pseudomonas shirazica]|uniref:response regulator n=1 Tax=Pseudomonas shirazica TaxID=1940636 RepID=UPI001118272C